MSVVVVGAGHASGQFVASLRQSGYSDSIDVVGTEAYVPYQRPPLSKEYLQDKVDTDRIRLRPPEFYEQRDIQLHLEREVIGIDRARKKAIVDDGTQLDYDDLVFATGSLPRSLDVPGADLDGVHLFRTIDDVNSIKNELGSSVNNLVIIGAGYIGLEVAASCKDRAATITVIELMDRVLERVTSEAMSQFYENLHSKNGIQIKLSSKVVSLAGDSSDKVKSVQCSDGTELAADVVIIGVGVHPNTHLAEEAGLSTSNGIVVDEYTRTSDPHIYAIGDCSNHPNGLLDRRLRLESVPNAMEQARIAAQNICGESVIYESYPWFWSDQYGLKLQMAGLPDGHDDIVRRDGTSEDHFSLFYFSEHNLIAVESIDMPKEFLAARRLLGRNIDRQKLADPLFDMKGFF